MDQELLAKYAGTYPRKVLFAFACLMELKLKENDRKGGWKMCSLGYLRRRVQEEIDELFEAIKNKKPEGEVAQEAADVANFAMMIADRYKGK